MRENIQYLSILMAPKLVHIFSPEFLNHGVSASVGCCDLDLKALAMHVLKAGPSAEAPRAEADGK